MILNTTSVRTKGKWMLQFCQHYLNQFSLILKKVQWHSFVGNFTRDTSAINHTSLLENYLSKFSFNFPGANEPPIKVLQDFLRSNQPVWMMSSCLVHQGEKRSLKENMFQFSASTVSYTVEQLYTCSLYYTSHERPLTPYERPLTPHERPPLI